MAVIGGGTILGLAGFCGSKNNELLAVSCCGYLLPVKTGGNKDNLAIFLVVLCRKCLTKEENERSLLLVGFVI